MVTDAGANRIAVTVRRGTEPAASEIVLLDATRGPEGEPVRWAAGRICRPIGLSPSGRSLAAVIDGALHVGGPDGPRAASGPRYANAAALRWISEDRVVLGLAVDWPPVRLLTPDCREVGSLEPILPTANVLHPTLATGEEAIAFCYDWRHVAVWPRVDALEHSTMRSGDGAPSPALGAWVTPRGESLLVVPRPSFEREDSTVLWRGDVREGRLEPWLHVPSTAAIDPMGAGGAVLAAPLTEPGTVRSFAPRRGTSDTVARVPGFVRGLAVAAGGDRLTVWTEDTLHLLERRASGA